jgi:hypothetical protein
MMVDALVTDVSDRPIETSPKGERYVVVSFREAAGNVTGAPEGVEVWEAMTPAEMRIHEATKEAVELAERANKAEFAVDYDRHAAGLKFIALRALVKAEGHSWEDWYAKNVHSVNIRTARRYMALAIQPEPPKTPQQGSVDASLEATEDTAADTVSGESEAKETLGKSPRRQLASIIAKLSESEAEQVLALVMKWRAKR